MKRVHGFFRFALGVCLPLILSGCGPRKLNEKHLVMMGYSQVVDRPGCFSLNGTTPKIAAESLGFRLSDLRPFTGHEQGTGRWVHVGGYEARLFPGNYSEPLNSSTPCSVLLVPLSQ